MRKRAINQSIIASDHMDPLLSVQQQRSIVTLTGVWRTGMSTVPAAPPIKYVLVTDPEP